MFSASLPYLICFLLTGALVLNCFVLPAWHTYAHAYVYT